VTRKASLVVAAALSVFALALPASGGSITLAKPIGGETMITRVKDGCGHDRYRNAHGHCRWMQHQTAPYGQHMGSPGGSSNSHSSDMMHNGMDQGVGQGGVMGGSDGANNGHGQNH